MGISVFNQFGTWQLWCKQRKILAPYVVLVFEITFSSTNNVLKFNI